jgi:hypothetical protein
MTTVRTTMVLLAAALACSTASAQKHSNPCTTPASGETSTWRVYADQVHHFCFRYPESYKPIPKPKTDCRASKLRDEKADADIGVCVRSWTFRPSNLVRMAPTGSESQPEPVKVGKYTFYFYGAGGGGVHYPDSYDFNFHGKILVIDFYGPYENDKSPTPETKKMELKLLATFREF